MLLLDNINQIQSLHSVQEWHQTESQLDIGQKTSTDAASGNQVDNKGHLVSWDLMHDGVEVPEAQDLLFPTAAAAATSPLMKRTHTTNKI